MPFGEGRLSFFFLRAWFLEHISSMGKVSGTRLTSLVSFPLLLLTPTLSQSPRHQPHRLTVNLCINPKISNSDGHNNILNFIIVSKLNEENSWMSRQNLLSIEHPFKVIELLIIIPLLMWWSQSAIFHHGISKFYTTIFLKKNLIRNPIIYPQPSQASIIEP